MLENEIAVNRFMMGTAQMLISDLPSEQWTHQALPGVNHPAWICGHLLFSAQRIGKLLGEEFPFTAEQLALFGPGSKLSADPAAYPNKEASWKSLVEGFEHARTLIPRTPVERFSQPNPNPRTKETLPTIETLVSFLLTGHLALHLGQLSAWRRMLGMPPLF